MTKKDFQALARALHSCKYAGDEVVARTYIDAIADVCKASNPRFDRERFIEACETGTTRGMRK